jgi:hypothetical protein
MIERGKLFDRLVAKRHDSDELVNCMLKTVEALSRNDTSSK